jgi:hypothetical protein
VVELEVLQIFLPYSFRLIGPQTKQGNMHPWSVKIGLRHHDHVVAPRISRLAHEDFAVNLCPVVAAV